MHVLCCLLIRRVEEHRRLTNYLLSNQCRLFQDKTTVETNKKVMFSMLSSLISAAKFARPNAAQELVELLYCGGGLESTLIILRALGQHQQDWSFASISDLTQVQTRPTQSHSSGW